MWWLIIVFLFEIIAVFMVRGRPYSGDKVVMALFNKTQHSCVLSWAPALLSFTWNVILPVGLMVGKLNKFLTFYNNESGVSYFQISGFMYHYIQEWILQRNVCLASCSSSRILAIVV